MNRPRVSILTFGCRANQYESDAMDCALGKDCDVVSGPADVIVLNGCTVTRLADRKARQAARRARRESPGAPIILIGCLADAVQNGLERFDEADLIAGTAWKGRISEVVEAALKGARGSLPMTEPTPLDSERTEGPRNRVRAFLRVQDGCSLSCAYCRPTQVRGPSRSKSVAAAAAEARELVDLGFSEIVLTGINLAQYAPHDGALADLVLAILDAESLRRLRIASINPTGLTAPLIDAFAADERLCRHFHVPLQSGDDRTLRAMQRGYSVSQYEARIERVRDRLPNATFGADVIVGFPGEDEDAFGASCAVVERIGFSNLHVFRYSPRAGTVAADLPAPVPERVKRARAERIDAVWRPIRRLLLDKRIGTTQDVLVEEHRDGRWCGYTQDYIYVSFGSATPIPLGAERSVRIAGVTEDYLEGGSANRDVSG